MYIEGAARPSEAGTPAGSQELAEGLMLLRASTLKLIRLQLALERQDRHVALEAVDDLVALDCRLQDYLDGAPAIGEQLMLRRELDCERAALNIDKLTLAAGVSRRSLATIGHVPIEQLHPGEQATADEVDAECVGLGRQDVDLKQPQRHYLWLSVFPALLLVLAAVTWFFLQPDIAAWATALAGAVK